jgi:hypothetical protein
MTSTAIFAIGALSGARAAVASIIIIRPLP